MILNKIHNNYTFKASFSTKKDVNPYEEIKKGTPNNKISDLAAASTAILTSFVTYNLSDISFRKMPFVASVLIPAALAGVGMYVDILAGKKINKKYKNDEKKKQKTQLIYSTGISAIMAPVAFSAMDNIKKPTELRIKISKDKKLDPCKSWVCKETIGIAAIAGGLWGLWLTCHSSKIDEWTKKFFTPKKMKNNDVNAENNLNLKA